MVALDAAAVRISASPSDKTDAIRQVGSILVDCGNIEPGYVDSMLARERVANTFLGNGIAIPHGIPKDRGLIRQTGVAVLQVPSGVEWNPGEKVHLVVGIAAKSDEHLEILSNLTDVLSDADEADRLAHTHDARDIASRLSSSRPRTSQAPRPPPRPEDLAQRLRYRHPQSARPARPAGNGARGSSEDFSVDHPAAIGRSRSRRQEPHLVVEARRRERIDNSRHGRRTGCRECAVGAARGDRAAGSRTRPRPKRRRPRKNWDWRLTSRRASTGKGARSPASPHLPGMAVGPIRQFQRGKIVVEAMARDTTAEFGKLDHAIESAKRELGDLFEEVWKKAGPGKAAIFRAHSEFLEDPEMIEAARALIREGRSAGWSWQHTYEERADVLAGMKDPVLSGRATDLRDVGRRVLRLLADRVEDEPGLPDRPVIIVADDLSPSDTARLDPAFALGLCTAAGGPTSHTAIIARSLDIPAVVGAGGSVLDIADDTPAVLDGNGGILVIRPTERDETAARRTQADLKDDSRGGAARLLSARDHGRRRPRRGGGQHQRSGRSGPRRQCRRRGRGPAAYGVSVPATRPRAQRGRAGRRLHDDGQGAERAAADHPHPRHRRRQGSAVHVDAGGAEPVPRRARHPLVPGAAGAVPHAVARHLPRGGGRPGPHHVSDDLDTSRNWRRRRR